MDHSAPPDPCVAAPALVASAIPFMAIAAPRDAALGAGGAGVPAIGGAHLTSRSVLNLPPTPTPATSASATSSSRVLPPPALSGASAASASTPTLSVPRRVRPGSVAHSVAAFPARKLRAVSRHLQRSSYHEDIDHGSSIFPPLPPPPSAFHQPHNPSRPRSMSQPASISKARTHLGPGLPAPSSPPSSTLPPPFPAAQTSALASAEPPTPPALPRSPLGNALAPKTAAPPQDSVAAQAHDANASVQQALYSFQLLEAFKSGDGATLQATVRLAPSEVPPHELCSPLHLAVRSAPARVVQCVLDLRPGDLNLPDAEGGNTALHLASALGRADVVAVLLAMPQVDVTLRNRAGQTASELAASPAVGHAFWSVYSSLQEQVEQSAQSHVDHPKDGSVRSALLVLLSRPIVHDLDLDRPLRNAHGGTLLHVAAARGDAPLVKAIGQASGNVYIRDARGRSPADVAPRPIRALLDQLGSSHRSLALGEAAAPTAEGPNAESVQLAAPICRGYLSKYYGFPSRRFKTRWFVLAQGILAFYHDPADEPVLSSETAGTGTAPWVNAIANASAGCLDLRTAHVLADPVDGTRIHVRGVHPVRHSGVRIVLRCARASDRTRWVQALRQAQVADPLAPIRSYDPSAASPPLSPVDSRSSQRAPLPPLKPVARSEVMKSSVSVVPSDDRGVAPPSSLARLSIASFSQPHLPPLGAGSDGPPALPGLPRLPPRSALAPLSRTKDPPSSFVPWAASSPSLLAPPGDLSTLSAGTRLSDGEEQNSALARPRRPETSSSGQGGSYGASTTPAWSTHSSGSDVPPSTTPPPVPAIKPRTISMGTTIPLEEDDAEALTQLDEEEIKDEPLTDVPHQAEFALVASELTTRSAVAEALAAGLLRGTRDSAAAQALAADVAWLRSLVSRHLAMAQEREDFYAHRYAHEVQARHLWERNLTLLAQQYEGVEATLRAREAKDAVRRQTVRRLHQSLRRVGEGLAGLPLASNGGLPKPVAPPTEFGATPAGLVTADGTDRAIPDEVLRELRELEDPGSHEDEFFDAVEHGLVPPGAVAQRPKPHPIDEALIERKGVRDAFGPYSSLRTQLPIGADQRPHVSLWSVLKNNIGKDLTKITFPVSFNEPTSMLQRMAEDMEFATCLDAASVTPDPSLRVAFVAAFAMSNYSSTIGRIAKPFNPLLGETFEYVSVEGQYRYYSEQVSHHPPVSACFAESPRWEYFGSVDAQNRFTGRTFDIRPTGMAHAHLKVPAAWIHTPLAEGEKPAPLPHGHNARVALCPPRPTALIEPRSQPHALEHYTWNKVTTCVSGFLLGQTTIDHYGEMEVVNQHTGDRCVLTFKPRGWRGKDAFCITGGAYDAKGQLKWDIAGKWSDKLIARPHGAASSPVVLWTNSEKPPAAFNLPPYASTLNDLPEGLYPWLPPTDSRLRPDLRSFETGKFDAADGLKCALEDLQRARRKEVERGQRPPHRPRWFERSSDPDSQSTLWRPLFAAGTAAEPVRRSSHSSAHKDSSGRDGGSGGSASCTRKPLPSLSSQPETTTAYWSERERSGKIRGLYHRASPLPPTEDSDDVWPCVDAIFGQYEYDPAKGLREA